MTAVKLPPSSEVEITGLKNLENYLSSRVIGQPRAIRNLVRSFNLAAANLNLSWRPLGVFFFSGPTGVGKTATALALNDYLYFQEQKHGIIKPSPPLVKIDSALFGGSLHFAVTELIGSPAGYIGSRSDARGSGKKPKLIRENFPPDRLVVLLWDEVEKALISEHGYQGQEISGILISMLDKGELTNNWDVDGPVNFRQTVVILTSNIAAQDIARTAGERGLGFRTTVRKFVNGGSDRLSEDEIHEINEKIYDITRREYERNIPPELRNRIDRLIVFRFLTRDEYSQILTKELAALENELREKFKVNALKLSDQAKEWFLRYGIIRELGVRSLQRSIMKRLRDPLSTYYLAGKIEEGCTVSVDVTKLSREEGKFEFSVEK